MTNAGTDQGVRTHATILDVVDNFLVKHRAVDFNNLPGRVLWQFGEEVRRFAAAYEAPVADTARVPLYIGGWPSANFYHADQGELVLSTLLYSGQVYAKDPLSDWFAPERHDMPQIMASRLGYLTEDGRVNTVQTRGFLSVVIPALRFARPLIESGALVLVPTMAFLAHNESTVQELQTALLGRLGADLDGLTRRFRPEDLAVDDRVRGMFAFAGGDREQQLRKMIGRSFRYFSQEWLLAQRHGVEYTAPWPYEQFICEEGLGHLIGGGQHHRVVTGLLHTQLPLFRGLTPKVLAEIRDDDSFAEFRASLLQVYKEIPRIDASRHFTRDLAQTEETLLRPVIERTRREADRGWLRRIGVALAETTMSVGARISYDVATGDLGWQSAGREIVGTLADRVRAKGAPNPNTAWIKLHRHKRTIRDELPASAPQPATPQSISPWHIDSTPSMTLRVSPGVLLLDDLPLRTPTPQTEATESPDTKTCDCGSGLATASCCRGLPEPPPKPTPIPSFWALNPH